jgi:glycosyltransferase involved in cell wall biosynthesis
MPELIDHGTTGFLVNDVAAATAAVVETGRLDRPAIREQAVARFSVARMVESYLDAYGVVLRS